jgi:hypothetical protein
LRIFTPILAAWLSQEIHRPRYHRLWTAGKRQRSHRAVVLTVHNVTSYFFFEPFRWRSDFAVSFARPSSSRTIHRNRFAMTAINTDNSIRVAEIAEILALGLTRLLARKSTEFSHLSGESLLHSSPNQSGDEPPFSAEVS